MDGLTDQQRAMLDFERQWWSTAGGKDTAIVERFGMSSVRYYQLLNRVLRSEDAMRYDPVTVNRLLRISTSRTARVS